MHPRQASLLAQASELTEKLAAKSSEKKQGQGMAVLWSYTDPDVGKTFYLEEKKLTGIRSPFSGKTITVKPIKYTPSQVGQELREEAKGAKKASDPFWKA